MHRPKTPSSALEAIFRRDRWATIAGIVVLTALSWAYLFGVISGIGGYGFGASTEVLGLSELGTDIGTALAIVGFIPIKDAAISALGKGLSR